MPPAAESNLLTVPVPGDATVSWERVERFVGQVSHDLRNGLNACELQLTFLGELVSDPEAVQEIKGLRATLAGLTRQLQALRLATAGATAHPLEYPAADLFEDLRERFVRLHPERAGRMDWKMDLETKTLVNVDPELVLGAGLELLNNAFAFADKDTNVGCGIDSEAGEVVVRVEETLSEIPPAPLTDWGRTPLVSTRRGAYGLGLFRLRRVLAAQGAGLGFLYSAETKTFIARMTLPVAPSPALP